MRDITELTVVELRSAVAIKEQIESLEAQVERMLEGDGAAAPAPSAPPVKRRFTAAARRRMAEAQRLRRLRENGAVNDPPVRKHKKRRLSPEGRAAIRAGIKRRWARIRAGRG
jgi:hypothetical protein